MSERSKFYPEVVNEIANNACDFTEFLASESVMPIRKNITLIPNIVKDILDVIFDNRRLKIQDSQLKRKVELAQQYLEFQDRDAQRKYHIELEKIHTHADISVAKIEYRKELKLMQIESEKKIQCQKIQSEERAKLADIRSTYELARQKQINEREMFQKILKESNKRYKRKMKNAEKLQSELSVLIKMLTDKMVKGTLNDYEYKLLNHFSTLKIQALEKSFDISEALLNMFVEGK